MIRVMENHVGFGWILLIVGLFIAGIGLLWIVSPPIPWLGRLHGDIRLEGEHVLFYFPIATCLLLSLILSGIIWVISLVVSAIAQLSVDLFLHINLLHINRASFAADIGKERAVDRAWVAGPDRYFHPQNSGVPARFGPKSEKQDGRLCPSKKFLARLLQMGVMIWYCRGPNQPARGGQG